MLLKFEENVAWDDASPVRPALPQVTSETITAFTLGRFNPLTADRPRRDAQSGAPHPAVTHQPPRSERSIPPI